MTGSGQTIQDTLCDNGTCDATTAAGVRQLRTPGSGTCANQAYHDCVSAYVDGTLFRQFASASDAEQAQAFMTSSTPASATSRAKTA